jgi:hypothetical protein
MSVCDCEVIVHVTPPIVAVAEPEGPNDEPWMVMRVPARTFDEGETEMRVGGA